MDNCKYQKQIFLELDQNPREAEKNLSESSRNHLQNCPACQKFFRSYQFNLEQILANQQTIKPPKVILAPAEPVLPRRFNPALTMALVLVLIMFAGYFANKLFTPANALATVSFQINLPDARSVAVAGDFNNWDIDKGKLQKKANRWIGQFTVSPGRYQYVIVVNREKILPISRRLSAIPDGFGSQNEVLLVDKNRIVIKI